MRDVNEILKQSKSHNKKIFLLKNVGFLMNGVPRNVMFRNCYYAMKKHFTICELIINAYYIQAHKLRKRRPSTHDESMKRLYYAWNNALTINLMCTKKNYIHKILEIIVRCVKMFRVKAFVCNGMYA